MLGSATLRISTTDIFLRYVKESFRPFPFATGLLLLMLGIWAVVDIWREDRAARQAADSAAAQDGQAPHGADLSEEGHSNNGHSDASHSDDGHSHGGMRIAWLLILPVAAIALIAPPSLGAFTAERAESTVSSSYDSYEYPALPSTDPVPLAVSEFAERAVWDNKRSLEGREVELTGFVSNPGKRGMSNPDAPWYLSRLTLACCAADASAIKIEAVGAEPLPSDTWVKVTGTWLPGGETDTARATPWIEVHSVTEIPEPKNTYE